MMIMNYLEVPLEFRFDANPADPARTFWVSFGARFGVLADAHSKLKFKENGEKSKLKDLIILSKKISINNKQKM